MIQKQLDKICPTKQKISLPKINRIVQNQTRNNRMTYTPNLIKFIGLKEQVLNHSLTDESKIIKIILKGRFRNGQCEFRIEWESGKRTWKSDTVFSNEMLQDINRQSKEIDRNTPNNCFNPNNPYPHQIVIFTRFAFFFIVCVYRLVSHQSVYDVFSL